MQYDFFELLTFFFIYGFIGWICEVAFAALVEGKFVNRGFLLGPICPIYGIGVVAVLLLLEPIKSNWFLVFVLSTLITSAVEYLIGFHTEKLLGERLWDYYDMPFNIKGYVCLAFSVMWGIGCMGVIYAVHPAIRALVERMPQVLSTILLTVFSVMIITDTLLTGFHALKLDGRMKKITEVSHMLESISNSIGKNVSGSTLYLKNKAESSEALKEKYQSLVEKKNIIHDHLFNAFDRLKKGKYKEAYEILYRSRKKNGK